MIRACPRRAGAHPGAVLLLRRLDPGLPPKTCRGVDDASGDDKSDVGNRYSRTSFPWLVRLGWTGQRVLK